MKYQQLRDQIRQLWRDHAGGVPLAPVGVKTWIQERVGDAMMEYTDHNAGELAKHVAFDMRLSPVETVQFVDWLMFARDYGFAAKEDTVRRTTP